MLCVALLSMHLQKKRMALKLDTVPIEAAMPEEAVLATQATYPGKLAAAAVTPVSHAMV